ncbi:MAG: hypothetical protein CVT86_07935, partial [Alphaproteobacteria bacterium HGW-Alphaproteobacteria-8]
MGETAIAAVREKLASDGWALLRGFAVDLAAFSDLTARLCRKITFDPARDFADSNTQKVDAGLGPIGLHIENGNTPVCPDIVAFYSVRAAFEGLQTTICDGRAVLAAFGDTQRRRWRQTVTVSRRLPEALWRRYLANEHLAISRPEEVTPEHLLQFQAAIPNQNFRLNGDGSLDHALQIAPVRPSTLSQGDGFANAILGPSHNYEPPRYTFADGSAVTSAEIEAVRAIAETCTHEFNWQDGDIAVLDNTRVMHGRRAIRIARSASAWGGCSLRRLAACAHLGHKTAAPGKVGAARLAAAGRHADETFAPSALSRRSGASRARLRRSAPFSPTRCRPMRCAACSRRRPSATRWATSRRLPRSTRGGRSRSCG